MTAIIREATDADAAAIAAIVAETNPHLVVTGETVLHRRRTTPPRGRRLALVAEEAGAVVAFADAGLDWRAARETAGICRVAVTAGSRRRGVGTALLERSAGHLRALGSDSWTSMMFENEAGLAFASRFGFGVQRAAVASAVDPRTVEPAPPGAVELVPVARLGPEPVYAVDIAAAVDEPRAEPAAPMPYDEWLDDVWNDPTFTADGSFAALVDDEPVSIALLLVAPELARGWNAFTATLPEHRGRDLALAAKAASLRWAARNGVRRVSTANDDANAPMLAINRRLGYRPLGRLVTLRRDEQ